MAQYTINVDEVLDAILTEISLIVKLPKEKYVENIVHGFLEAQFRGKIKDDLDRKPFSEIKTYDLNQLKKKK